MSKKKIGVVVLALAMAMSQHHRVCDGSEGDHHYRG